MATTNKIPSPFKLINSIAADIVFEAVFDLPDDGTQGGNKLVIRIQMNSETATKCDFLVMTRTYKDTILMEGELPISSLGNLLYGFARIKHVPVLVLD
jgi:hypothetical protein